VVGANAVYRLATRYSQCFQTIVSCLENDVSACEK